MWRGRGWVRSPITTSTLLVWLWACGNEPSAQQQVQDVIGGTPAVDYPESVHVNMLREGVPVGSCSGAVIAPGVVLTAGHCIDGYDAWGVYAPYADEQGALTTNAIVYDWTHEQTATFDEHDVGLIFVSQDFTLDRYPTVASEPAPNGAAVVTVGRVAQGFVSEDWLFVSPPFEIHSPEAAYPFHYKGDRVVEHGDSGGPVILWSSTESDEPHRIVAVNATATYFAKLDDVHDWIVEQTGL